MAFTVDGSLTPPSESSEPVATYSDFDKKPAPAQGDYSFKASIETLLICLLTILLVSLSGGWLYFVVACTIAPFLLLKTECSANLEKRLVAWVIREIDLLEGMFELPLINRFDRFLVTSIHKNIKDEEIFYLTDKFETSFRYLLLFIGIGISKVISIVYSLARHPIDTIRSIPNNWIKVCGMDRISDSVDLMPNNAVVPLFGKVMRHRFPNSAPKTIDDVLVKSPNLWFVALMCIINYVCVTALLGYNPTWLKVWLLAYFTGSPAFFEFLVILCALVTIAFRWSLKATSLIWLPLLFCSYRAVSIVDAVDARLNAIRYEWLQKAARIWAIVWILFLITKLFTIVLAETYLNKVAVWFPELEPLHDILVPTHFPLWQIASLISSFISIATFVFVDTQIKRRRTGTGYSDAVIDTILSACAFVSTLLLMYTMPVFLYLCYKTALKYQFPDFKFDIVP
jgi:hypothetical protein